jgi:hypothetical protein
MKWLILITSSLYFMQAAAHAVTTAYVYDSVSDSRAMVFNLNRWMFSYQDKHSVQVDEITEFAGDFENCENKQYFCISGSINIVVPRILGSAEFQWSYQDINCTASPSEVNKMRMITCSRIGYVSTQVNYSVVRGIVSLRQRLPHDRALFQLRGYRGLFAKP